MSIDFFGERLKAVRKSKRLTQLDLSQRLEVSKGTVSAYEQGLSYPSLETFVKICAILDTSADYLLGVSDNLPFKMGGLTDSQVESILQFVSLIERANEITHEQ
ncbi:MULTISPECIES: helix-turn-helix domain-containing protein [Levilactobacillus]|jgi:transcriptional regulator with XRE-family HTH domain|uniref:XRE family transcriptional regulator n=2 Tax=Levilactobacillus TaxID=2767886 RepID=A0A4Z0J9N2_9LACO|nr:MULTISPECIES: helix-turn-helix transcriptional regulator [Levilactobacillus]MCH4123716.1 helix-turn-helix domain-containing protein [Levilactobacillus sp.]MCI1553814.1 helix-turn-helix domain-containing protein [Levilactobacillus sp.]MCI1599104.1 helix-turn-helix domain-containing protein [Levilactobacillus sp.]MCI1606341.1 helix-turn-helix domain-containing protein [Levilactobacillus sp.]TGD19459.1 XRE family transcriptional regulator [Levilactobacillus suantsaiihabitans]